MNYTDPEIAKSVAEWAGLEINNPYHPTVKDPHSPHFRSFKPWSDLAGRWQLNYLLEAVEDAGFWDKFVEFLKDRRLDHRFELTMFEVMTADPMLVYEAVVDTIIEAGEIDGEE